MSHGAVPEEQDVFCPRFSTNLWVGLYQIERNLILVQGVVQIALFVISLKYLGKGAKRKGKRLLKEAADLRDANRALSDTEPRISIDCA